MRFLADENIPRAVIGALADLGHDVASVRRGAADRRIVARAERERRVLLPFDKDFGDIAFGAGSAPRCGIILLRFVPRDPEDAVSVVLAAIASRDTWDAHFAVVERDHLRVRPHSAPRNQ